MKTNHNIVSALTKPYSAHSNQRLLLAYHAERNAAPSNLIRMLTDSEEYRLNYVRYLKAHSRPLPAKLLHDLPAVMAAELEGLYEDEA
jgi:hypothetical protein